jgi:hypothetical protein
VVRRRLLPSLILASAVALIGLTAYSVSLTLRPVVSAEPLPTWPVRPEVLAPAVPAMPAGFGPATWALDPAYPAPGHDTSELHLLVWEQACSSGSPATGRMSAPVVVADGSRVIVSIGVRQRRMGDDTFETCPLPPGTPAIVQLPEPLGSRVLLDGGVAPPAAPSPVFEWWTDSPS